MIPPEILTYFNTLDSLYGTVEQTVTDEEQRQLEASRERLKREEERRREQAESSYNDTLPKPSKPKVTNYPTATKVPTFSRAGVHFQHVGSCIYCSAWQ